MSDAGWMAVHHEPTVGLGAAARVGGGVQTPAMAALQGHQEVIAQAIHTAALAAEAADRAAQATQALEALGHQIARAVDAMTAAVQAMGARRRVVRDQGGRISHIEADSGQ